ncbi:MAG: twin-arginine translocase TatA/TatE family subunit [Proteobacteria bacterium]|nr:twin-arginine translocase TatA/TatE family subunit [Pseudomonadota bacterium]
MGFGITELIVVLVIVILLFGTKKLRSLGSDLGGALKGFRGAMKDVDELEQSENMDNNKDNEKSRSVIEGEVDKTPDK